MTIHIDVKQDKTVVAGPLFRVVSQTTYAYGISPDIFVYDVETDTFSHVATVWDIVNVRNDKVLADVNMEPFYRRDNASVDYTDQGTANAAAEYTLSRVDWLAAQYNLMITDYLGSETHTVVEP